MVHYLTTDQRDWLPEDAFQFFTAKILAIPAIHERVMKGEPHTIGCALFDKVPFVKTGNLVTVLVEYNIASMIPGLGLADIFAVMISDTKMPDEFLDRINYYRNQYAEGTGQFFSENDLKPKQ